MPAYIINTGSYLPGPPISNDQIESILGKVHGKSSKARLRILKSNGIQTRHYAMDQLQNSTHQNEDLAASAGRKCLERTGLNPKELGMLAVATSQGDYVLPGFASMVQARLGLPEIEILSAHGICCSGLAALKAAKNSIELGEHKNALVIASELCSRLLKASHYEAALDLGQSPDFNSEFLRWMLSDGAGALMLSHQPANQGLSLKIDWIRFFSYANAYPVCMSVGHSGVASEKKTWQDYPSYGAAEKDGALLIRQDIRMLDQVVKLGVEGYLKLIDQNQFTPHQIDHLLIHYSSDFFRSKIVDLLTRAGAMIPFDRWFTNLYQKGNTGSASIFIMLDEFFQTKSLKAGEKILCHVPESGRFNTGYMHLTVVEN